MINKLNKLIKYSQDPDYRFLVNHAHGFYKNMPDDVFLKRMYKIKTGRELDLENPKTFNEKLQWLKIHDRKPVYTTMVDKYAAKDYVASTIGKEYIIPTLGIWDSFDEIDFDALPNQFVLKCTHDSGGLIICRDKTRFDYDAAREKISVCLKRNYYDVYREWPYKNVPPRVLAEKYMEETFHIRDGAEQVLNDYKIYTINGKAMLCMINQDRGMHTTADYFDREFNWLDFTWGYSHAAVRPSKPKCYEKMFQLAERLAVQTTELRVDFYIINEQIFFGELTFFDGSGFDMINPQQWDEILGALIKLPNIPDEI